MLIKEQTWHYKVFYALFGAIGLTLLGYYLSATIISFTTPQQFPISSFQRFPLTMLMFPAEVFSIAFGLYFVYLLLADGRSKRQEKLAKEKEAKVAILIPVYNEPRHIVERTVKACTRVRWEKGIAIYILDDSTDEGCKTEMRQLAQKYGARLVRRNDRKGYKAGNINNGVSKAMEEAYFAILDSDQAPKPEFLEETMPQFNDPNVGFVQVPQYYVNEGTLLERAAKTSTNIFFHTQCASKANDGALPFCGTNAVLRADVFRKVKGFSYYTSTEDIELGLKINQAGYHGAYVPKILVEGYGPYDFPAYQSQQYRWANGNLAILREYWLKLLGGVFPLRYQMHTLFTLGWWLIGLINMAYIAVLLLSLFFGMGTHHAWLPTPILAYLYANVLLGILLIYLSIHGRVENTKVRLTDALLQYSLLTNSMFIYAKAAINALTKRYIGFVRTNKTGTISGWRQIKPNLALGAFVFGASIYALYKSAVAPDFEHMRMFLPISLWLLFYSVVLGSSMLFVGSTGAGKGVGA